jgi:hypothetical protein
MAGSRLLKLFFLAFCCTTAIFPGSSTQPAQAAFTDERKLSSDPVQPAFIGGLWHDPGEISFLDLAFGCGGKEHAPRTGAVYSFVKEDLGGTSTKFYVKDDRGVEWLVKVGDEARPETAATRLVWAMGYFTDEDYFVAELHVAGITTLHRHSKSIHKDGTVTNARLKRSRKGQKKLATWAWDDNPFLGSRELNGLRVLMALINNWDLKTVNNKIYGARQIGEAPEANSRHEIPGGGNQAVDSDVALSLTADVTQDNVHYVVSDLGASFGRTGAFFSRSKGKVKDFAKDPFIRAATPQTVDFVMRTKPGGIVRGFKPHYYRERGEMADVVRQVPRAHAKWIGSQLARLTPEQIRSAFFAAGFTPREIDSYTKVLSERISELNAL